MSRYPGMIWAPVVRTKQHQPLLPILDFATFVQTLPTESVVIKAGVVKADIERFVLASLS